MLGAYVLARWYDTYIIITIEEGDMMGFEMILSDVLPLVIGIVAIWIVWKIISGMLRIVISLAIIAAVAYLFMGNM